jgi:hypothetical protein
MRWFNLWCQQLSGFLEFGGDSGAAVAQEEKAFLQQLLLLTL